jgi:hypothetical protein
MPLAQAEYCRQKALECEDEAKGAGSPGRAKGRYKTGFDRIARAERRNSRKRYPQAAPEGDSHGEKESTEQTHDCWCGQIKRRPYFEDNRIGRANAGFSRKVSVIRDSGNCVVGPGGLEPPTRPL